MRNSTNPQIPEVIDVRINTAVICVLKNKKNDTVPATLVIEDEAGSYHVRCVDNLANLKTAVNMVSPNGGFWKREPGSLAACLIPDALGFRYRYTVEECQECFTYFSLRSCNRYTYIRP